MPEHRRQGCAPKWWAALLVRFDDWLHSVKFRHREHPRRFLALWRLCQPVCHLRSRVTGEL